MAQLTLLDDCRFPLMLPDGIGVWSMGKLAFRTSVLGGEHRVAVFSPCGLYRYVLAILWGTGDLCQFIGLNPSTATEIEDDPTVRRCKNYARDWGFDGMVMTNLFGFRATDPKDMKARCAPIGPANTPEFLGGFPQVKMIVAAWGGHGVYRQRSTQVRQVIGRKLYALALNKNGEPGHPLYLKKSLKPQHYRTMRKAQGFQW